MGWFFTKAALVTFGGAYAVLPYVYQGAVDTYAWVTPLQMMDGLALGETTPGPLIMMVAFVGFMGGHINQVLGPDQLFLAAASAACIVTWFTFLPSFLFIFAGGPLIESTHNDIHFTAPLTAITAAVVGVIVNLACFFAYHVLWNDGFAGSFDVSAAILAIAAATALIVYKQNILKVIVVSAVLGLILQTVIA
jgi:chromate transporter